MKYVISPLRGLGAAFDNIPTPEQMANNWYNFANGTCEDCPGGAYDNPDYKRFHQGLLAILKDTPPINGVPQIKYVNIFKEAGTPDDLTLKACYDRANELALANPDWANRAGQDGMIKVATICKWEAQGRIPDGYMQDLITALANKSAPFDKRWLWAGAAVGAYILFFRK
jgi:hypothetical protein